MMGSSLCQTIFGKRSQNSFALFEMLTLVQTRKVKPTPVLLYGSDYWKRLIDFEWMVTSGTISKEDLACFKYVDSPAEAWTEIQTLLPC